VTNHLAGSAPVSSYVQYQGETWLSFQLIHSGHALNVGTACPGSGTTWQAKQKCAISRALDFTKDLRGRTPTKPVVNGEGPYEHPQQLDPPAFPPDNQYGMRHAAYASLFTGAAGSTAGVDGDLAKGQASIVGWVNPLDVLSSPGASTDMPKIKKLLGTLYPGTTTSWGEFSRVEVILTDSSGQTSDAERRIFGGVRNNNYVAYIPNSEKVTVGSGLNNFKCMDWTVRWHNPRESDQPPNPCPKNQVITQFTRPLACANANDADKRGLCDWAIVLQKPSGVSGSALGSYVTSRLVEATVDGELVLAEGGDRLLSQLMSADDIPIGTENQVSPDEEAFYGLPVVVKEPFAGVSWVVWEAEGSSAGESTDIFARRVGPDGAPLGEAFLVNQQKDERQYDPFVVADAAGKVTLVWVSVTDTDALGMAQAGIVARQFRADGTPLADEFQVSTSVQPSQESPAAGADAAGNLVVGWVAKGHAIVVRLFDSDGTPSTGEIFVNKTSPAVAELVEVVVDPLGGFVVRWNEYSDTDELLGWFSRAFDAKGQPLGDVVSEGL
jgi:hypothetical protein